MLNDALEALERRVFFEALNETYADLRADEVSWLEIEAERAVEAVANENRST